jgi:branched-subunit amino acid ABC-type transport system permease component
MSSQVALFLLQDGVTTGAIYVLLAIALVMVFLVTRVLLLPQGEFVSYSALTLAMLQTGAVPGTVWLLLAGAAAAAVFDVIEQDAPFRKSAATAARWLVGPLVIVAIAFVAVPLMLPLLVQALLTMAIIIPLGPIMYRLAFQRLQSASLLVLLIVAMAVHLAMVGFGLVFFGAEGWRTPPFSDASISLGDISISGQSMVVVVAVVVLTAALYVFFEHTLIGKALRATGMQRTGARLMAISTTRFGRLAFMLAAAIGAASGILIAPLTTIYYDTGFLIGLKGFVGAIVGGMVSYPLAALGALAVGLLESWSSYAASAFKEVIVFTLIIPFLLWRSLRAGPHAEAEQDEE